MKTGTRVRLTIDEDLILENVKVRAPTLAGRMGVVTCSGEPGYAIRVLLDCGVEVVLRSWELVDKVGEDDQPAD